MTARATLAAMATVARHAAGRALAELGTDPASSAAERLEIAQRLEEHARELVEAFEALAAFEVRS